MKPCYQKVWLGIACKDYTSGIIILAASHIISWRFDDFHSTLKADLHALQSSIGSVKSRQSCFSRSVGSWIKAATLSIALIGFVILLSGGLFYESNDDVSMSMLCAGVGIVDRPDDHLLFTNHLIGRFLGHLYDFRRSAPWYALYLLTCQALAFTVIFRILFSKGKGAIALAITAVCSIAILLRPIVLLQFTSTSFLLGTAGVLSILVGVERKSLRSYLILGIVLLVLSVMVRDLSALMTVGLAGLLGLSKLAFTPRRKKAVLFCLVMFVCGLVCVGGRALDRVYFDASGWKNAAALNSERSFVEMHKMSLEDPKTREALAVAGWSTNDFRMFKNWGYLDRDLYSLERFKAIRQVLGPLSDVITPAAFLEEHLKNLLDLTQLPIILAACIFLLFANRRKLSLGSSIFFLVGIYCALSGLILILRVPPRVYASVFVFAGVLALWFLSPRLLRSVPGRSLPKSCAVVTVLLLLLTPTFFAYWSFMKDESRQNLILKDCYAELRKYPERVYVNWATGMALRYVRPFDDLPAIFGSMKIISVGCRTLTPMFSESLVRNGIRDLARELDKENLYLCARYGICRVVGRFLLEHYHLNANFKKVFAQPELPIYVYKVKFEPPERPKFAIDKSEHIDLKSDDIDLLQSVDIVRTHTDLENVSSDSSRLEFESTGPRANLQFSSMKGVAPSDYGSFQILAAVDTVSSNRNLVVYFATADGAHHTSRIIRPWFDGEVHGYRMDVSKLGFPVSTRIGLVQILPFHPDSRFGGRFRLESAGFIRRAFPEP